MGLGLQLTEGGAEAVASGDAVGEDVGEGSDDGDAVSEGDSTAVWSGEGGSGGNSAVGLVPVLVGDAEVSLAPGVFVGALGVALVRGGGAACRRDRRVAATATGEGVIEGAGRCLFATGAGVFDARPDVLTSGPGPCVPWTAADSLGPSIRPAR